MPATVGLFQLTFLLGIEYEIKFSTDDVITTVYIKSVFKQPDKVLTKNGNDAELTPVEVSTFLEL